MKEINVETKEQKKKIKVDYTIKINELENQKLIERQ
jgi:hypothetical protein